MTVGSYSMDNYVPHGYTGSWVGTKGSKTWNGADQAKAPRVRTPVQTILREIWNRKTRRYELRTIRLYRSPYTPKRARRKDPHVYTMDYMRQQYDLIYSRAHSNWVPDGWLHQQTSVGAVWSNLMWQDPNFGSDYTNNQIKLVGRLTEQLQGSDFNLSVFLGELPQTLDLLADSAIRIRKSVTRLRRGDLKGSARILFEGTGRQPKAAHDWRRFTSTSPVQSTARNWLELQYGWLPLLKDAEGAAQSIAHALHAPFQTTYRASVRVQQMIPNPIARFGDTGWVYGSSEIYKTWRRSLVAYIKEDRNWTLPAQLGLLDPELVAWELVPFSFVADWFIPIGQWMEQRAKAGRLVGTFVTTDKFTCLLDKQSFDGVASGGYAARVTINRSISNSLDVPMPKVKSLDKAASWQHCANALALVTGMFGKSRP